MGPWWLPEHSGEPAVADVIVGSSFHSVCNSVDGGDGVLQAQHFGFDLLLGYQVMLDVKRGRRQQVRAADGDAARNGNAGSVKEAMG